MAQTGHGFETWRRPAHDGTLRCLLCADLKPGTDRDWCPAAGCIVCDTCCDALLDGDVQRLVSIAANAGRVVTPDALFNACSECARVSRRLAGDGCLFETDADGRGPAPC